jgi:hypothetical protein
MNDNPKCRHCIWFTRRILLPLQSVAPFLCLGNIPLFGQVQLCFIIFQIIIDRDLRLIPNSISWQSITQRQNKHSPNSETDTIMPWVVKSSFYPVYRSTVSLEINHVNFHISSDRKSGFRASKLRLLLSAWIWTHNSEFWHLNDHGGIHEKDQFYFLSILMGVLMFIASF